MGYRDELVRRMQESGDWDQLTSEKREFVMEMSDEFAGAFLAQTDEAEANFVGRLSILSDPSAPEAQQIAVRQLTKGIVNLSEVFDGRLVDFEDADNLQLTGLGRILCSFVSAVTGTGYSLAEAHAHLANISLEALMIVQKLLPRDEHSE